MLAEVRRAPRGARGLKFDAQALLLHADGGRAPRGARGLKSNTAHQREVRDLSRPSRGAWIEILELNAQLLSTTCRAPRGARGLKCLWVFASDLAICRAPRGARGLKFYEHGGQHGGLHSRAPRGARGLKYLQTQVFHTEFCKSRPSRGAWIEMLVAPRLKLPRTVAPLAGRVD